jgi:hypothetical protein
MDKRYVITGRVQRIEFSDQTFDAYVRAEPKGAAAAPIFQVRSEYRFPLAEIEKQLLDQDVSIYGWPARTNIRNMNLDMWTIYSNCAATCAMYGVDFFRIGDGTKVTPAGPTLTVARGSPTHPPVVQLSPLDAVSANAAVLTGKVLEAKSYERGFEFVVEEITRKPMSRVGQPRPGTIWTVYFIPVAPGIMPTGDTGRRWIGRTVTFSEAGPVRVRVIQNGPSSNAPIKDCESDCKLASSDILAFD